MGQKHCFFSVLFQGPAAERPVLGVFNPVFSFFFFFNITSCNHHKLSVCPFAAIPISAQGVKAFLEKPLTVSFFTH